MDGFWVYGTALYYVTAPCYKFILKKKKKNYNQGDKDNENVTVLPDHLFVRLSLAEDHEEQNEDILRPWINPHNL